MRDVEKIVKLGQEFAEPWRKATKVLSVLLVIAVFALIVISWRESSITIEADYNNHSEISQTQG